MTRINDIFEGFASEDIAYINEWGLSEFTFVFIGRAAREGHTLTMSAEQVHDWLRTELVHREGWAPVAA